MENVSTGKRRIGVFVCHCGGNISDYVDVRKVIETIREEPGVAVAKAHVFTCSDASQKMMIDDIKDNQLDGLVIASCSPKLHMTTFRSMSERAGLNPYQYVQVNMREQCSWAHTDDRLGATEKGISLVRAGIAKCALSKPLQSIRVDTLPRALVVGAGVSGLRAALALSDMGLTVYVVEREPEIGGQVPRWGRLAPDNQTGRDIIDGLQRRIRERDNIIVYTDAELVSKSGNIGDFRITVRLGQKEAVTLEVGAILVTTGFAPYEPRPQEFGYGLEGVLTFPQFRERLARAGGGTLTEAGRPVRSIVYVYCVGSRQKKSEDLPEPNTYCSRYCCTATCHTAVGVSDLGTNGRPAPTQYHLFRDIRTYGRHEVVYEEARARGSQFLRYDESDPPVVKRGKKGLTVTVKDQLLGGEELEIPADLVVLITGMVPRENESLNRLLKLPLSQDGFYNEIHVKLRPVETVIDGVFIAGSAQSPKSMAESVASSLAAVAKAGGLLRKGFVNLEPLVAKVNTDRCIWCDECTNACPYNAVEKVTFGDKEVALVNEILCKGEGACVPVCPHDALDIEGFTDEQITAMIDACSKEVALP